MKTFLPLKTNLKHLALLILFAATGMISQAQPELEFKNGSYVSGSGVSGSGSDSSVYRFVQVTNGVDALVKINGRSSSLVTLSNIDVPNTGYSKAFQPQISYNGGSVSNSRSWWMEFKITFVDRNTTTPVSISTFKATALDIDGDNNRLHEWVAFYAPNSYTLESPTLLTVSNLVQTIVGILSNVGKTFDGITTDKSGIDTTATNIMTTVTYNNASSIIYRAGAATTGSSNSTNRNYSLYFKNFNYSSPIITLPVKLISFSAVLNQSQTKVDLKWATSSEINASHFVVEKSMDGTNFSDAGLVFAYGNTTDKVNYSFSDNIGNRQQSVIYYRLRSVDNDAKYDYSETRIVRIGNRDEGFKMITYPNPVTSELRVTLPSAWQGKGVIVELYNQSGQRMKVINTGSASQTETIAVSDLKKGFYLLKASCGSESAQQKVLKY